MNNKQNIGEAQVTPAIIQKVAPDVVSKSGMGKLGSVLEKATKQKAALDQTLSLVAKGQGADFSSRIKNPETIVQKIATKRLAGRDYGIDDVNDSYGARFIVDNKSDIPKVLDQVRTVAKQAGLKVLKDESVSQGTYKAHHIDFQTPGGVKGEIQTMLPQQALEAVANHSLRSTHGENPPPNVKELRNAQAKNAKETPNDVAKQKTKLIQDIAKQNNDKPTPPMVNASVLAQ